MNVKKITTALFFWCCCCYCVSASSVTRTRCISIYIQLSLSLSLSASMNPLKENGTNRKFVYSLLFSSYYSCITQSKRAAIKLNIVYTERKKIVGMCNVWAYFTLTHLLDSTQRKKRIKRVPC